MASLGDMVVRIRGDMTDFNRAIDASEAKFKAATANFQKLGANLTKFVTLPILGIGAAAVKAAADMEMQEAAFETMLGSAEAAKGLLQDLTALAAKTPFQLTDLAESTKTMLAFGIAQEKVLPNLQMLGDIAGGNADKLRSLTLAFSQIQSTGRLMGQDLLQLINAGFNPLQTIAEKTGKTMAELKKDMENGAISADMVSDAFKTATSEGGRFFGGMERASQTLKGQFSTLLDNMMMLGRGLGDVLLPALKNIVTSTTTIVQKFTAMDEATRTAVVQYGLLAAAVGPLILGILQLIRILPQLKIAMAFLSANPVILGISAVAAGIALIAIESKRSATYAKNMEDALKGVANLENTKLARDQQVEKLARARLALETARKDVRLRSDTTTLNNLQIIIDREATNLKLINDQYNGLLRNEKQRDDDAKKEQDLLDAQAVKAKLEQEAANAKQQQNEDESARIAAQLKASDELIAKLQEEITVRKTNLQLVQESRDGIASAGQDIIDIEKGISDAVNAGRETAHQLEMARIEAEKQARISALMVIKDAMFNLIGSALDNQIAMYENMYSSLTEAEQAYQDFLDDKEAERYESLSEEDKKEYDLRVAASESREEIEKELAQRLYDIKLKAAKFEKAQAIVDTIINTATAVSKALTAGPIAGPILAAVISGLGLAQVGIIRNQALPEPPALAEGGVVMPTPGGTLAQIAEAGQPEAVIPLDRFGELGGDIHLVVNLDSKPFLDKIFPATRNRQILISAGAIV